MLEGRGAGREEGVEGHVAVLVARPPKPWRTAVKRLTPEELAAKVRNTEAGRAKRRAAKAAKAAAMKRSRNQ